MAQDFDSTAADRLLSRIAEPYDGTIRGGGGGVRNGCNYDSYFYVEKGRNKVSFAIRNPRSDEPPYIAIKRKFSGRNVVEDRIPLQEERAASAYFAACATMLVIDGSQTIGLKNDTASFSYQSFDPTTA